MDTPQVIVFTRMPRAGRAKTRLIPTLGAERAAQLQREMTGWTALVARQAAAATGIQLEVRYADGSARQMRRWLGRGAAYRPQRGVDLGVRMADAFRCGFSAGRQKILIIGTDCPAITPELISEAITSLHNHDLVLGPAADGGYYLVGLRREAPQLFEGIAWSSREVLRQTVEAAEASGLSVCQLETLKDIDRPEDIKAWEPYAAGEVAATGESRISVIIPALNESAVIASAIRSAASGSNVDITVVDGGSSDDTVEVAKDNGARVVTVSAGRGGQMNAGVGRCSGDALVFLHADAQLPGGYGARVRKTLSDSRTSAGAFRMRIDGAGLGKRLIERLTNFRSRYCGVPYGDQAIFVSRKVFQEVGGYSVMPIMEDYEFMHRVRHRGRIVLADESLAVSSRRWSSMGVARTTVVNQLALFGYRLGISPARLAAFYGVNVPGHCD